MHRLNLLSSRALVGYRRLVVDVSLDVCRVRSLPTYTSCIRALRASHAHLGFIHHDYAALLDVVVAVSQHVAVRVLHDEHYHHAHLDVLTEVHGHYSTHLFFVTLCRWILTRPGRQARSCCVAVVLSVAVMLRLHAAVELDTVAGSLHEDFVYHEGRFDRTHEYFVAVLLNEHSRHSYLHARCLWRQ